MNTKMKTWRMALCWAAVGFGALCARGDESPAPFAFGIVPGLAWPTVERSACVLRLSVLAGWHSGFTGLDFGSVANITDGEEIGIALAGICNVFGEATGVVQFAGMVNCTLTPSAGVMLAAVNWADEDYDGFQIGCLNFTGDMGGFQLGVFNRAENTVGLQLGVCNVAESLGGVQFGLVNIIQDSTVPVLPLLNFGF